MKSLRALLFAAAMGMVHAQAAEQQDHQAHAGGHAAHGGHAMQFDATGMVMNSNRDQLPLNCMEIADDVEFTVHAGVAYAEPFPGRSFAYSRHEFRVPACSRVTVTLVNEDEVRHQWMLHGLPRYLYPQGMFHLEAAGGQSVTGSFIVPADDATYLVHCDITQHMEKGMKAQLIVGAGAGSLWSIPGVSASFILPDDRSGPLWPIALGLVLALGISAIIVRSPQKGE